MKSQSTGGTAKNGYKKLPPEGAKKTVRKERVSQLAPVRKSGAYRGNAGRSTKKK